MINCGLFYAEQHIHTITHPLHCSSLPTHLPPFFPAYLFLINALPIKEAVRLHWQDHRLPNQNECEPCHRRSCWARPFEGGKEKNCLSPVQLISPSSYYYWIKISLLHGENWMEVCWNSFCTFLILHYGEQCKLSYRVLLSLLLF